MCFGGGVPGMKPEGGGVAGMPAAATRGMGFRFSSPASALTLFDLVLERFWYFTVPSLCPGSAGIRRLRLATLKGKHLTDPCVGV